MVEEFALQVIDASAQDLQERLLADELDVAIYAHGGMVSEESAR